MNKVPRVLDTSWRKTAAAEIIPFYYDLLYTSQHLVIHHRVCWKHILINVTIKSYNWPGTSAHRFFITQPAAGPRSDCQNIATRLVRFRVLNTIIARPKDVLISCHQLQESCLTLCDIWSRNGKYRTTITAHYAFVLSPTTCPTEIYTQWYLPRQ